MFKKLSATALVASLLGGFAQAATTTANLPVTATVQSTCSASAAALAFGAYTPGAGAKTGNTTVSVRCTKNTAFTVALNAGATSGGSLAQRLMGSGANTLQYNLYTTASFASIFGDGTGGTLTGTGTGAGVATVNALTVFGNLPDSAANQAAVPGNYSDTILVTVTY